MKRIDALAFLLMLVAAPVFAASQWSTVGGDSGNTRYSSLAQINSQNITKLGAAWVSEKLDAATTYRAMPVVDGGLMFLTAPPYVYAVNINTGKIAWRYRPTPTGSPAREGVAVGEGLVFVGLSDANLVALREETGELVWKTYLGDPVHEPLAGAAGAPLYADGLVSIGLNADYGYRGQIIAVDAKTGREAWRFFPVPAPGEPGSDTWPKNNAWKHGGGAVWLVGASDPELGLVFYVTGNATPQYGGENRPGDNLYTCSVIALDSKTGKLRWHYQVVRHDIWEADIAETEVLFDAQINGQSRKAIAAIRVDGYLFMLDRATGKPLGRMEDRRVPQDAFQKTAATQPYPVGADHVLPDCDYWKTQPIPRGFELGCFWTPASVQKPNLLTPVYGMRGTPMAFDPQTQFFYVTGNAALQWFRRAEDPDFFSLTFSERVPGLNKLGFAVLAALDSRTNKIVWKKEFPGGGLGRPSGALATAGGLVFQMAGDGNLQAYDATNGSLVWQFQTGAPVGSPPFAFENAGEQYIATVVGRTVWAFKLGGTLPAQPAPAVPPQEDFAGPITDTANIETAALARDMGLTGQHYMTDEYEFNPYRARVKAGTRVHWRNNGTMVHTIVAEDGSWTTGTLEPLDTGTVTFDKPGTYVYHCKEHPWVYGQIIVEPTPQKDGQNQSSGTSKPGPLSEVPRNTSEELQQLLK